MEEGGELGGASLSVGEEVFGVYNFLDGERRCGCYWVSLIRMSVLIIEIND